jgi:LuxR family maltose regulon positive regulatory protein
MDIGAGVPAFLITRPAPPAHAIERRALWSRLDELIDATRVVAVAAPAGFGKTSALSGWAASSTRKVAWLSLTPTDRHPERLARGLSTALDELGLNTARSGSTAPGTGPERGEDGPRILVIDDVHLISTPGAREVLSRFLEHPPGSLRVILAGRQEPHLGLHRLLANGELSRLTPSDLAFTTTEVQLAADAMGLRLPSGRAAELQTLTRGWPVAVRLALMSWPGFEPSLSTALQITSDDQIPQLADYLLENVIGQLPPSLRSFVPRACVCDWLTGRLASELAGDASGPELLERAVALGLPLERHGTLRGEPVYRWHPVMAQAGRAILLRHDPELAVELDLKAARFLAAVDPHAAASHALRGRDPELAADLIRQQWLGAVLRGDSELIEELCARLPGRWADDPEILSVRATCRRNAGDAADAAELSNRAAWAALSLDPGRRKAYELTNLLANLFIADDYAELTVASESAQRVLATEAELNDALRASAKLLIGWTELKLRHGLAAVRLLREAAQLCQAEGLDDLAERARANHTYALAFTGDFLSARLGLAAVASGDHAAGWRRTDGGVEAYVRGWIEFWSGDTDGAMVDFQQSVDQVGSLTSYSQLARIYLVHSALARGDHQQVGHLAPLLDAVPEETIQGLPWRFYKGTVQAGILLSRGDAEAAAGLLDDLTRDAPFAPATVIFVAELYWRCGRPGQAREQAALLLGDQPPYLRAGALVVTALCERLDGSSTRAHSLLEEALELGSTFGLARPFHIPDRALSGLLVEHAAQGTRHAVFLASQIAYQSDRSLGHDPLSGREREILGYLATTLTAGEICEKLFISPNTLKSHLRSIYRKVGVENRRDAVRFAGLPASTAETELAAPSTISPMATRAVSEEPGHYGVSR